MIFLLFFFSFSRSHSFGQVDQVGQGINRLRSEEGQSQVRLGTKKQIGATHEYQSPEWDFGIHGWRLACSYRAIGKIIRKPIEIS